MIEKFQLENFLRSLDISGLPSSWFESVTTVEKSEVPIVSIEQSSADPRLEMDLVTLNRIASTCTLCALSECRKNVVFGDGKTDSPVIAFVGEGPGADEDETGLPFVGKAGRLLTDAIEKGLGLTRKDVYICNVVKCRPPQNRTPQPNEVSACTPYLYRQLELIKPKVIVTLGQTPQLATSGIEIGITKLRGQWQEWRGFKLMPTYHPAYILRNPEAKKPFWEDLQEVMKFLGMK